MPKNLIFLLTEILDWVRPPPFWQKNPKNSEFFSVNRNFGFGKTPAPPFRIFSEKNQFFLNDASPYMAERMDGEGVATYTVQVSAHTSL